MLPPVRKPSGVLQPPELPPPDNSCLWLDDDPGLVVGGEDPGLDDLGLDRLFSYVAQI